MIKIFLFMNDTKKELVLNFILANLLEMEENKNLINSELFS